MAEHPEACAPWQDDLAGWLVAQLDPAREAALLAHLDSCEACRAEAGSLLAVAAVSLGVQPEWSPGGAPAVAPRALGERIAAAIRRERRHRRGAWVLGGVAAAVVALGALLLLGRGGDRLDGTPMEFAVLPPGATAEAVVAPADAGATVEVVAAGLDPAVTYALWLTPPGAGYEDRVPAGTFRPDDEGRVDVRLPCALPAHEAGRVWATTPDGEVALDTEPPHRRAGR